MTESVLPVRGGARRIQALALLRLLLSLDSATSPPTKETADSVVLIAGRRPVHPLPVA